MVGEVFAGIGAFKSMIDIAKTVKDASDLTTRQRITIELQEQILAARESQSALVDDVKALKTEIAGFETWDAEKQRYELKPIGNSHVVAYALKSEHEGTEPPHWICPDCYQKRQKSILQMITRSPGRCDVRVCQVCDWEVYLSGMWMREHK